MNKKLMALAVAGALAAPAAAFAQASNVQIYGRINTGVDSWSATGSTVGASNDFKTRTRVFDSGSRLGFRGTEDLGGGLKTIWVLESGLNVDTGSCGGQFGTAPSLTGSGATASGCPNASAGTLASRDSYLGLAGDWGDVRFGRQSIYWVSGPNGQTGANYINNEIGWYNGADMGRVKGPTARTSNVMSYNSPTWNGFNFTVSYAPNSESAAQGANTDASISGVTLRYEGPIGLQYDHAQNQAASGGAHRLNITGDKFSIGWPYQPGARVALMFIRNKNNDLTASAFNSYLNFANTGDNVSQSMWGINWEHMIGNWQLLGMYSKLQKATGCSYTGVAGNTSGVAVGANGCDGSDSTGYTLGLKYFFSKRTQVYVSWIDLKNGSNQIADVTGGAYSSAPGVTNSGAVPYTAAGADVKIFALGVWHAF